MSWPALTVPATVVVVPRVRSMLRASMSPTKSTLRPGSISTSVPTSTVSTLTEPSSPIRSRLIVAWRSSSSSLVTVSLPLVSPSRVDVGLGSPSVVVQPSLMQV